MYKLSREKIKIELMLFSSELNGLFLRDLLANLRNENLKRI